MMNSLDHGGNVVALERGRHAMRFQSVLDLRAYWEALRAGRSMPQRSEVDPRGIERVLEFAFILERIAPGIARFRLAGTHLHDLMGMDVRGMPLTSFFVPGARDALQEVTETVFSGPAISEMVLTGEVGPGRAPLQGRLLMLPMKSGAGDVTRALGCLETHGTIGRNPRRFDLLETRSTRLNLAADPLTAGALADGSAYGRQQGGAQVGAQGRAQEGARALSAAGYAQPAGAPRPAALGGQPPGMAEAAAGFAGPARPYLRLIKSED